MTITKKRFDMQEMDFLMKSFLMVLMIVYLIIPFDLMAGPIDDAIVLILGMYATNWFDKLELKAKIQ